MKLFFSLLSICFVMTIFGQCPSNGPFPYQQGQNRKNAPLRYSQYISYNNAYTTQAQDRYYYSKEESAEIAQNDERPKNEDEENNYGKYNGSGHIFRDSKLK